MRIPLLHVSSLLYNTPLLITADAARMISAVVERERMMRAGPDAERDAAQSFEVFPSIERADGTVEVFQPQASRFVGQSMIDQNTGRPTPYAVTPNGTGIISIVGELVNRGRWIGASSGIISYEGLKHQAAMIGRDPMVKQVILDIESPGGAAIGCFDTMATIRKLASVKPVTAFINGFACSGGYGIASAATRIVSIPEGKVGSIGVMWMHCDYSAMMMAEGMRVTFVYSGDHKVDANPYEPLPKDVQARIQGEVDAMREMFVAAVAAGRPSLTPDAISQTEALIYSGAEAKQAGLIDAIGTFDDLLMEMEQPDTTTIVITESARAKVTGQTINPNTGAEAPNEGESMDPKEIIGSLAKGFKALAAYGSPDEPAASAGGSRALEDTRAVVVPTAATMQTVAPTHYSPVVDGAPVSLHDSPKGERVTTDLNIADCAVCLRNEMDRRDAVQARATAASKDAAEQDRLATIEQQADAVVAKYALKGGKAWADVFRSDVVEALTMGGDIGIASLARMERLAKAMPDVGPQNRTTPPEQPASGGAPIALSAEDFRLFDRGNADAKKRVNDVVMASVAANIDGKKRSYSQHMQELRGAAFAADKGTKVAAA